MTVCIIVFSRANSVVSLHHKPGAPATGPPCRSVRDGSSLVRAVLSPCPFIHVLLPDGVSPMTKAMLPIAHVSFAARLRRLDLEFLRPHRRAMFVALAAMFLGSLFLLPVSLVQGWILDRLLEGMGHDPAIAENLILWMLGIVLTCHL